MCEISLDWKTARIQVSLVWSRISTTVIRKIVENTQCFVTPIKYTSNYIPER